mmetsp:Transcript_53820/g.80320  ORF Transcript_53820/g.80320 Transcript_53820/m.80320 type:complete len:133 (-) Transcript_53820:1157-1555(-)
MVLCCSSDLDVVTGSRQSKQGDPWKTTAANKSFLRSAGAPSRNCDGYPPALMPDGAQVDFYLPLKEKDGYLACTLVRARDSGKQECHRSDSRTSPDERNTNMYLSESPFDASVPVIIVRNGYESWRNQMFLA